MKKSPNPKLQQFVLGVCAVTLGGPLFIALSAHLCSEKQIQTKVRDKADSVKMEKRAPQPF